MTEHDDVQDLLASMALGAVAPEEELLVLEHVERCAGCRAELDQLRAAATTLALGVTQHEPRPQLKRGIMAVVEREAVLRRPRVPEPRTARSRLRTLLPTRAGLWPALAGTLAALAIGFAAWGLTSTGDGGDQGRLVTASARLAGVNGDALVYGGGDTAVVRLAGLPPLEPGRGYELWVVPAQGAPRSVGFMAVSPDGGGRVYAVAQGVAGGRALAVTREPLGNRTAPSEAPIVTLPLPA